ncbi:hypothetical protein HZC34_05440 [Candidatus Saganbacteria bacterium]|nr:hypothetical protein [Candidatus Saganbacteria bacterium]
MKNLEKELIVFAKQLQKAKNENKITGFALIGALAVSARSKPRATQDIDFLVSAENDFFSEIFPKTIKEMGYSYKIFKGTADDPIKGLIRIFDKNDDELVDIIPVFWKWQEEMVNSASSIKLFENLSIPIALAEDLVVLKLKAGGPQDLVDVQELLKAMKLLKNIDKDRMFAFAKRAGVDRKLDSVLKNISEI